MKLLKKAQPVEAPPSLVERIERIMAEGAAVIEGEAQRIKATDAQPLPIDWLRQDLRARTGGECNCRCALKLLEPKQ